MEKITVTIDLTKIDKSRIQERTYTVNGSEYTAKEYKVDVVSLKEPKTIKEGDSWRLIKKYFVCDAQTKDERENKVQTNFLGDGIIIEDKAEPIERPDKPDTSWKDDVEVPF